jgi:tetratricopeptide (TPR) repeat protein
MPRPSKRVAPDTLGGKLRAARQSQHLSLADVAGKKYSTSLISQIERNRVDPSTDSLQYLSDRLKLPLEELLQLAHQHRQSETEANLFKAYEETYAEIQQLLAHRQPELALEKFKEFDPTHLPLFLRWRGLALRGQSYFELRLFSDAQRDFLSALTVLPTTVTEEEQLEVVRLCLHLAAATRELNQFKESLTYYHDALRIMDDSTPLRYVAEAHWGLALIYYLRAQNKFAGNGLAADEKTIATFLQEAWKHAEDARTLYNAIADVLNAALLQCQMALIEQMQGKIEEARQRLQRLLDAWQPALEADVLPGPAKRTYPLTARANVVSSTACCLAGLEYQVGNFAPAHDMVTIAIQAGETSTYRVRRAEAHIRLGEILEAQKADPAEIEQAFRKAVDILKTTHRVSSRVQAHYQLGRFLLSIGKVAEGTAEIDQAYGLAGIPRELGMFFPTENGSQNEV